MGRWQMEVFRMGTYVFAPVVAFYAYHQVEFFEDALRDYSKQVRTPEAEKLKVILMHREEQERKRKAEVYKEQLESMEKQ